MQTEIIFFGPNINPYVQNVTTWTTEEIDKLKSIQSELGRPEHKIRKGYPVYCSHCSNFITLSPVEHSHLICDVCQRLPITELFKEQPL